MSYGRYAIYYTPAPGALAEFGAAWLGWDPVSGESVAHPDVAGLPLPVHEITNTPRKYGFHATLKPPFRLAPGKSAADLLDATDRLCGELSPITLQGMEIVRLGRFLALVPMGDVSTLNALAAKIVKSLDVFRASATDAERARWQSARLSDRQRELLSLWGYPYVLDQFRFHITLTGKLPKADAALIRDVLVPHLAPLLDCPFPVDGLSVLGEDENGRFQLIRRYSFSGKS